MAIYDDDIDTFFNTGEFAENIRYIENSVADTISVIWDAQGEIYGEDNELLMTKPMITVKTSDVPNISKAANFERYPGTSRVKTYKVFEIGEDNAGTRDIFLTED